MKTLNKEKKKTLKRCGPQGLRGHRFHIAAGTEKFHPVKHQKVFRFSEGKLSSKVTDIVTPQS